MERLRGKGRAVGLIGAATAIAVAVGVVWGVLADASGIEANPTTTTASPLEIADAGADKGADGRETDSNQPGPTAEDTTTMVTGTEGGSGGSGGSTPAPPVNQPPIIEDPGISSDGLALAISPVVTDPEGDEVEVVFTIDGEAVAISAGTGFSTEFDFADVGYAHTAEVTMEATDSTGNRINETFTHELKAVTTVTVQDVEYRIQQPGVCFADNPAVRIAVNLDLAGSISHNESFNQELRTDRTTLVLLDEMVGETVGEPGSLDLTMLGGLLGKLDVYEDSHNQSDAVLANMFPDTACKGFLTYTVDMAIR